MFLPMDFQRLTFFGDPKTFAQHHRLGRYLEIGRNAKRNNLGLLHRSSDDEDDEDGEDDEKDDAEDDEEMMKKTMKKTAAKKEREKESHKEEREGSSIT